MKTHPIIDYPYRWVPVLVVALVLVVAQVMIMSVYTGADYVPAVIDGIATIGWLMALGYLVWFVVGVVSIFQTEVITLVAGILIWIAGSFMVYDIVTRIAGIPYITFASTIPFRLLFGIPTWVAILLWYRLIVAKEDALNQELEKEGFHVIPTARATWLTMNREGIRRLAAEELGLPTSPYRFAETEEEFIEAVKVIGMPCVVKPIMSSSGHGQSIIRKEEDIDHSWHYAQEGGRAGAGKVIVEGFVDFDYEITQLTVRHIGGTSFLEPVGHVQVDGDYRESWQPQAMNPVAKEKAREIAGKITEALGGRGIFGVELFVKGEDVIFSEVSPRPHDTGMVTMITQDLSQFALHARAILGLPIPNIAFHGAGASRAVVVEGDSNQLSLGNLDKVLEQPDTQMRFFGKPEVHGHRRMAVLLARGLDVADARRKTGVMMERLEIKL